MIEVHSLRKATTAGKDRIDTMQRLSAEAPPPSNAKPVLVATVTFALVTYLKSFWEGRAAAGSSEGASANSQIPDEPVRDPAQPMKKLVSSFSSTPVTPTDGRDADLASENSSIKTSLSSPGPARYVSAGSDVQRSPADTSADQVADPGEGLNAPPTKRPVPPFAPQGEPTSESEDRPDVPPDVMAEPEPGVEPAIPSEEIAEEPEVPIGEPSPESEKSPEEDAASDDDEATDMVNAPEETVPEAPDQPEPSLDTDGPGEAACPGEDTEEPGSEPESCGGDDDCSAVSDCAAPAVEVAADTCDEDGSGSCSTKDIDPDCAAEPDEAECMDLDCDLHGGVDLSRDFTETDALAKSAEPSDGDDHISGTADDDAISSLDGDDIVSAGQGADVVDAGAGHDAVYGDGGDDVLDGSDGDDLLHGGDGSDEMNGGAGRDLLVGGAGADLLVGGEGADSIFGSGDADTLFGVRGDDYLDGEAGDDRLWDGDGADIVHGGEGSDVVHLAADDAADMIDGGSGRDMLVLSSAAESSTVEVAAGLVRMDDGHADAFVGFEAFHTGAARDEFDFSGLGSGGVAGSEVHFFEIRDFGIGDLVRLADDLTLSFEDFHEVSPGGDLGHQSDFEARISRFSGDLGPDLANRLTFKSPADDLAMRRCLEVDLDGDARADLQVMVSLDLGPGFEGHDGAPS